MATPSDAQAVKSLNKSSGRGRFVFKTFSQRIEDIEIDVFRSLDPLKAEPSEGSSFLLDCLVQWRELNTAEDFISFYEEMMPLVQTLPQIILHKELILSKLLSRLQMKGRLSLEPILRLIAALSRDLLEDFFPSLQLVADSLVSLLKSGADREPEIIEQIFTSWSCIMMYLQKYLIRDIVHVLKVTVKLRYYPKDYVQEFMAEGVSFLLRNAPVEQLIKGLRKVMFEVVKKPFALRKSGASALLWYAMRGSSSRLHSRAEQVLRLLTDNSILGIGDKFTEGSVTVVEVAMAAFQRLCEELEPTELNLMWNCLYEEITESVRNGPSLHLTRLLSLLISTLQIEYARKFSGFEQMLQLIGLLVRRFIVPAGTGKAEAQLCEVVDKILELILCILDALRLSDNNMSELSTVALQWASVFDLRNSSLLSFIGQLLLKDPCILNIFKSSILRALDDLIETSEEEVIYLVLSFCESLQNEVQSSSFIDQTSKEEVLRISKFIQETIGHWIGIISDIVCGDPSCIQLQDTKLALLWGVITCYPYIVGTGANTSLLMDLVDAIDRLLMIESDNIAGFHKRTWQSLIGAALCSHLTLHRGNKSGQEDVGKILDLAKRYKSSSQVLATVADYLDSRSMLQSDPDNEIYYPELKAESAADSLGVFAENLCHLNKNIRLSTLRILCHYEPLNGECPMKDQPVEKKIITEVSEPGHTDDPGFSVLQLLFSIESTPLSVSTSRKVILLISRIQMGLSAARISEIYLPSVLYGIIGILHNRFTYLWNPALECISVLVSKYAVQLWEIYIQYLERCMSIFVTSHHHSDLGNTDLSIKTSDLVERFNLFVTPASDSTPCTTIMALLIQSMQKVPTIAESRSRQIIPLFLKFLGYKKDNLVDVRSYDSQACTGKEWKVVLEEWLTLLKLMRNSKSFYRSQFLKEVLQYRLLDENDAEIQMKVIDCLLNWRDEFLLPYDLHLKNLISSKNLREELTTWGLSKESNLIEERHRTYLVPLVIRILTPKVRNLKDLASRKHASINLRKAVLGFLAQLDVDELPLFFALLIKPLLTVAQVADGSTNWFLSSPESSKHEIESFSMLKCFTMDTVMALSWKKRYGFLHVIEDLIGVFDEMRIKPFLDLLIGCVVRVLASCTSNLESAKSSDPSVHEEDGGAGNQTGAALKQFKDLRSLCLKIISLVLNKYEDHDFGCGFWDLFFASVKPLIDAFKQEGASSEKPSSLFSCFLAMSRTYRLVTFLYREKNLVPDIFSILTVTTASEAIVSLVLKFIENLLILDTELDDEDNSIKGILLPNLDALVCSLHCLFKCNNSAKRKLVKCPGERELHIFKLLTNYIKDPTLARKFVDMLLPMLRKRGQNFDAQVEALLVIRRIIPVSGDANTAKIMNAVSSLLISADLDVRLSICDLLDALSVNDSSAYPVAKVVRELNATSVTEMGDLDYDMIGSAYEKISKNFFYAVQEEHALIILSHAVHDMSQELSLKDSAYGLLLSFVEFSAEILDGQANSGVVYWSEARIHGIINKFLIKHMGDAMNKETSLHKWIALLREMVLKLPKVLDLDSLGALCNEDEDQDFFKNVIHLQKHRRARALSRLSNLARSIALSRSSDPTHSKKLSEVITNKVFVPLLFNMLFDVQDGKGEHVKNACVEALASISGHMEWKSYYALLIRCFLEMTLKPNKQKVLLRLVYSILDHFHFWEVSKPGTGVTPSSVVLSEISDSAQISEIKTCLDKIILPKIQKLLTSDSDYVNVNINLVALKLLKLLPGDIMESQLPSIIHRISNFLKNRLDSVRDEARSALAACLKELGVDYLQFIVKVLKATLKRGYELHVLGYTLNFILSKCLLNPIIGKLDYCLEDILSVAENDILGEVSEEKEVEKIASKMKETRKRKSFETLKLIAQNITFKTHALKLLTPVTAHLQKHLSPKMKLKLETMLNHLAVGIAGNPSVNQTDLFVFIYGLIEDSIATENSNKLETSSSMKADKQCSSHIVTVFALGVLHNRVKSMKLDKKDEQLLSMLDPFIRLLSDCLNSKYENTISAALMCLAPLVRLPLPSLEPQANKIKTSLFLISQGSVNTSRSLMQSCLSLLIVLLKNTRLTLSTDQLHMLIQFPVFVDLEKNPSFVALSLLKAIVKRKLVVPEIYDLAEKVSKLMVTSQSELIRKKCSQILLQFLLDYHLSEKRLQEHLDLLLVNLRYEHSTGREAVLEMLHAIVVKFPKNLVDDQSRTVFLYFVACLANDNDNKVRSMAGAAIKLLIGRVSPDSVHSFLEYSFSWYSVGEQDLWSVAAQVLGLLVEAMKNGFESHVKTTLPIMKKILQSALTVLTDKQLDLSNGETIAFWKEAYYSLVMFEKILQQFPKKCLERNCEDIWEAISELLLHPHMWLRSITNRLVAFYFTTATEVRRQNGEKSLGTFFLMKPGRLFLFAVYFCRQLSELADDDENASTLITKNLVFAIHGVHSLVGQSGCTDPNLFWSTLEHFEQGLFLKAFQVLDPRKGRSVYSSLTSDVNYRSSLVSCLLKRMGAIAVRMEAIQMRIVFNSFKLLSSEIFSEKTDSSQKDDADQQYVYHMLIPLYKVCEGFVGKVIPDDVKQLAQEVRGTIRTRIGGQNFDQVYVVIRKNMKVKREKRKRDQKVMAVVNPTRNAKRKERIKDKNRDNKRRKTMKMKIGKWSRQ